MLFGVTVKPPSERGAVKNPKTLTAFGETKTYREWAKDPRCSVNTATLVQRVRRGGRTPEEAVTAPPYAPTRKTPNPDAKKLTAFGETKTIAQWAKDQRSTVTKNALQGRLRLGWAPEKAITTPVYQAREYEAYGEKKTLLWWARDPRCVIDGEVMINRVKRGWPLEKAMTQPVTEAPTYTCFGETKTLREWAQDPRCAVKLATLKSRMTQKWTLEQALMVPRAAKRKGRKPRKREAQ
jgi:hypothetical protein